jgi:LmbE family N-acetylglucosaminyl deacetylase
VAITEAAVFYSRLTKWDDTFAGLPVHTVPQFLTYFLFAGVAQVPPGHWPLVVDIAAHLETKLAAIACYASQFPPEKAHIYPRVRSLAETVGMMAGCAAGEVLASSRMPLTTEPMRMLFPPP